MKILIDGRELIENRITGIGRFLRNFLEYAVNFRPDWSFVLLGNQYSCSFIASHNLTERVVAEKGRLWWDQIQSLVVSQKERPDIYFSPYYKCPLLNNVKTIVTVHDLIEFILPDYRRDFLYRWMVKLCLRKADRIVTVSQSSREDVCRILRLPWEKIVVSYNSVQRKPVGRDKKQAILARYGIRKGYVLYVGNFNPHKNIAALIRAYSLLPAGLRQKWDLVIAGGRPEALTEGKTLEGVVFPGHIDESDLPAVYEGAGLFVFPSLYEGFGLPPLEAMAYGIPVIASNRPAMVEILGEAAEFFEPHDNKALTALMAKLLSSQEDRKRCIEEGLQRVRKFETGPNIERILNTMETLVGS
ncbi:MAG: glycosyltransferase family 4 protein [Desulfobacterales bacterium]|nr:MAG: glycosyltransferase family 4 protein [Desulfobacterales bacterium]